MGKVHQDSQCSINKRGGNMDKLFPLVIKNLENINKSYVCEKAEQ